jgi:hypothetical protein
MVKVWLDKQAKSDKRYFISSGETPPTISSRSSMGAIRRAEKRYDSLGRIPDGATLGGMQIIGYVTKKDLVQIVSEKQDLLQEDINGLEKLKSKIDYS